MSTKTAFRNGHFTTKCEGDTMWKEPLTHLDPPMALSGEEAAEQMFEDGCVQFPDLLNAEDIDRLRTWMDSCAGPDADYEVANWCFNRHLPARPHQDPTWLTLMDRDPVHECLELVLGARFIMTSGSMWTTGKGRAMGLHVDRLEASLPSELLSDPRVRIPIHTCTLHYYLEDQVEEIGPTVLVPGSWRAGRHPINEGSGWNGIKPRMISVKAGGAMLFRHDLWHGAEMNRSARRRYMIQVHFADHTRARHYPPLSCEHYWAPEVLARLTPRQRVMLGGEDGGSGSGY